MTWTAGTIGATCCGAPTWRISNSLSIEVGAGNSADLNGVNFSNSGTVRVKSGTFSLGSGAVQTAGLWSLEGGDVSATLNVQGGTLSGSGIINGNVTNSGTINVGNQPGTLTINGKFTQNSTGVTNVQIGGTSAGTGYDQLVISGAASLNGVLNVSLINSFAPTVGQSFQILSFSSRSGTFSSVTGTSIGSGKAFSPAYSSTGVALNVISA
jgi:hypothetical protein